MTQTDILPDSDAILKKIGCILRRMWLMWLLYRLFIYPLAVSWATGAEVISGVVLQVLVMLPALILTPSIKKGQSPYALIIANFVALIYLAITGVFLVMRFYENAPMVLWVTRSFECVILLAINVLLFVLLRRLPPMHRGWGR